MRILRRASLVLSLTLIVAIAVMYVARRSEVAHERDLGLTTAAEVGASQMASVVNAIEIAATAGTDARLVATALADSHPSLGVCVLSDDQVACEGHGVDPDPALVTEHVDARARGELLDERVDVTAYETSITIEIDGPGVSVLAVMPYDAIDGDGATKVWVTQFLPDGVFEGDFTVANGTRQTATGVPGVPAVYVVASASAAIPLPTEEARFYMLIFTLAVILLGLAGATLVIEHRGLVERASFDQLTRLPNRGEFERCTADAIATAERQGTGLSLMLFDLNGFKLINDTYGHIVGDEMLKVIGSRLRQAVRDDDIVARWGGDEFVVVMPGVGDPEMAKRRAQQLAEQVAGRTRLDGVADSVRVKVSAGIAIWPQHGAEVDRLVEAADQAMYQAKRDGETFQLARTVDPTVDPTALSI